MYVHVDWMVSRAICMYMLTGWCLGLYVCTCVDWMVSRAICMYMLTGWCLGLYVCTC
jgi:hypothetical protein